VRNPARLASAVEIVRCSYNFIRPHQALRFGTVTRTPAMQAGAATRPMSWREIFCWPLMPVSHTSRNSSLVPTSCPVADPLVSGPFRSFPRSRDLQTTP
jgi:hypothetical protein